jgi:DUF4097 and DUF4098 domain-containing protein YvlB
MLAGKRTRIALLVLALGGAARLALAEPELNRVMGSIEIAAGERAGDLSTVNGSIRLGQNASVGAAQTVNGSISVESSASATRLKTVNGSIRIDEHGRIGGDVQTVNGKVTLADGAEVGGQVANVNGTIHIAAAHVARGIDSVGGDILLGPNARIEGGVHIGSRGISNDDHEPRIIVGPGTVVTGTLKFDRPVRLYVSERATVGAIEGATALRFTGDTPAE